MRIGTSRERAPGETRVALTPDSVERLSRAGHEVWIERGAGEAAGFPDAAYEGRGARLAALSEVVSSARALVQVAPPAPEVSEDLPRGAVVIAPLSDEAAVARLRQRGAVAFALERLPRITRAQSMDVLSSMSTVAGYRAVILAAHASPRFFPLLMTAAGTISPARVLVIGAGVAGLQAIATARRLGAQVEAFDTRPAVKEQVESLGARFLEIGVHAEEAGGYAKALAEDAERKEREALAARVKACDVVITTALVPGRPAPRIIGVETVRAMKPGSVIVDLAAPAGGNCELTRPGETAREGPATILGPLNLPAEMPDSASRMFSRNVESFLALLAPEGELRLDFDDEILAACCVARPEEAT